MNGARHVNPATRQKVELAIDELHYVPNIAARSLRSRKTYTLALLVPDMTNPFWTTVARGIEDTAQDAGYSVLLCNTDENPAKQLKYLNVILSQRVDGVIIAPYASDAQHLTGLRQRKIPTVIVDRRIEGWNVDSVQGDSFSGAYALTKHLLQVGHKQIAMVSGPANTSTAEDRVAGYCQALVDAGLPVNPRLIRRGEYRSASGEKHTHELLDEGLKPTAIFAANNALALGVINALEQRGLRLPQDVALVCFDEMPDMVRLLRFLTVVAQPAYDIGVNAAQLLLSRLEAEVTLQPRHVVLPTRLLLRYSCGRHVIGQTDNILNLHLPTPVEAETILVKPIRRGELREGAPGAVTPFMPAPKGEHSMSGYDKSDINRLLATFRHQEPDRVPHLEFWVTSKTVYEYVLERRLAYDIAFAALVDARAGGQSISPEDHVEFAQRLGMDAVACNFSWRPNNIFALASDGTEHYVGGSIKSPADLDRLEPPVPLADQLSFLERYLRAAQGTGVGIAANFTSFFDSAMLAFGMTDALYQFVDNRPFIEKLMDLLLDHQEKVMRSVCDRFADDLAFVVVNDDIAHNAGLKIKPALFETIFMPRIKRLIAPAKEHGKLVALHSGGKLESVLPTLHQVGFDIIHPVEPESNDIFELKRQWGDRLAFVGNIPTALLACGTPGQIDEVVKDYCVRLGPGGGNVIGSSSSIMEGIPPVNFVAMTKAVHKYGRYEALGIGN
jgi:LacI family transcriptional regulator